MLHKWDWSWFSLLCTRIFDMRLKDVVSFGLSLKPDRSCVVFVNHGFITSHSFLSFIVTLFKEPTVVFTKWLYGKQMEFSSVGFLLCVCEIGVFLKRAFSQLKHSSMALTVSYHLWHTHAYPVRVSSPLGQVLSVDGAVTAPLLFTRVYRLYIIAR